MAEIKSTLDLVMQRTRNLSLSDEEKVAQRQADFLKNLNGLVQRFEDGQLRLSEIEREFDRLEEAYKVSDQQFILTGLVDRLDLEKDNRPVLSLLQQICRVEVGPVEAVLQQYRETIQEAKERQSQRVRDELLNEHRISGSAVVGLPQSGSAWQGEAATITNQFGQQLKQAISALLQSSKPNGERR